MIALPAGTQIWIAAGVTDLRRRGATPCGVVAVKKQLFLSDAF